MTEEPDEPNNVSDKELAALIDQWLAEARPERYDVEEDDWMESVIEKARDKLVESQTVDDAFLKAARRRVRDREGQAVKRMHAELRKIAEGKTPLGWPTEGEDWTEENKRILFELLHLPLKVGAEKVQFGAMSREDWRNWRLESQRLGDEEMARRIAERRAAERIESLEIEQGTDRTDSIRWS